MSDRIIALDIGGTNIRVSLVKGGKILKYIKRETPKTKEEIMNLIYSLIDSLITKEVKAIGIGCPGPLKNGVILNPPNLPFKNFNLKKAIETRYKKRTIVQNDVYCAALAEHKYGWKKNNFILIAIGTGVGGGIFINSKPFNGSSGLGGEIGHIILNNGQSFEKLVASKHTKKITKEIFGREMLIRELLELNNKKSNELIEQLTEYIGQGIGSLINIFDPEMIIIAGGLKENGKKFLNLIKRKTEKYSILPKKTPIEFTKLEHPGTLGAGLLVEN